jgi:hypothetical protein
MDLAGLLLGANGGAAGGAPATATSGATFGSAAGDNTTLLYIAGIGAAVLVLIVAIVMIQRN